MKTKMTLENFKQLRNKQIDKSRKKNINHIDGYLYALKTNTLDEYHKKRGRRKKNESLLL